MRRPLLFSDIIGRRLYCPRETKMNESLSVVVPVYRSAQMLRELHRRLVATLATRGSAFEIIFVEDCGGDDSWRVIDELARGDARVAGIRLSRNFGQHNALLCGIRAARHDVVVTIDDDLQLTAEAHGAMPSYLSAQTIVPMEHIDPTLRHNVPTTIGPRIDMMTQPRPDTDCLVFETHTFPSIPTSHGDGQPVSPSSPAAHIQEHTIDRILERWGRNLFLVQWSDGSSTWAHREDVSDQDLEDFEKDYKGFRLGVEVLRTRRRSSGGAEYRVRWKGRPHAEDWWVKEKLMSPEIIDKHKPAGRRRAKWWRHY